MSARFKKKVSKPVRSSPPVSLAPKDKGGRPRKIAIGPRTSADPPLVDAPAEPPPFKLDDTRQPVGATPGSIPVRVILRNCANVFSTTRELAAILGISEPTLFEWFKREPEARAVWDSAREGGKFNLRRKLFNLADKNGPVAIFLAMNHLDLVDKRFVGLKAEMDIRSTPFGRFLQEIDGPRAGKVIEGEVVKEDRS